jgi:hypothetical protein
MYCKPTFFTVALVALFAFETSAVSYGSTPVKTAIGFNESTSIAASDFRPKKKKVKVKKRKKCEAYGG